MGAEHAELAVMVGGAEHGGKGGVEPLSCVLIMAEPGFPGRLGDPGRMLEHPAEADDEQVAVHGAGARNAHAAASRYGCFSRQCRAISTRRQNQTPSCCFA